MGSGVSSQAIYEGLSWVPNGQFFYNYNFAIRPAPPPAPAPGSEKEYAERFGDYAKQAEAWNQFLRTHPNYDPDERMPEDKRFFIIKKFIGTLVGPLIVLWVLYCYLYYGGGWVSAGFNNTTNRVNIRWLILPVIGMCAAVTFLPQTIRTGALIAGVSTIISFFFFVQKQKLDETHLFKDLFTVFNGRYKEINTKLNTIIRDKSKSELNDTDKDILFTYFNLCAEEYLYFARGYIPKEVWYAWRKGISFYLNNSPLVSKLWEDEEKKSGESYYGLTRDEIEKTT